MVAGLHDGAIFQHQNAVGADHAGQPMRQDQRGPAGHQAIEGLLDTHDLPPLDLLIRTSGEQRLSNFLLWEAAYAELYFTDTLWPDFSRHELQEAIRVYQGRERRFGLTSEQVRLIATNGA